MSERKIRTETCQNSGYNPVIFPAVNALQLFYLHDKIMEMCIYSHGLLFLLYSSR